MNNHDFPPSFKCMFSSIKYLSWDQCRKLYTAIEITHNIFEVIRDKTRFVNKDYFSTFVVECSSRCKDPIQMITFYIGQKCSLPFRESVFICFVLNESLHFKSDYQTHSSSCCCWIYYISSFVFRINDEVSATAVIQKDKTQIDGFSEI